LDRNRWKLCSEIRKETAERARGEALSYEEYLLELTTREQQVEPILADGLRLIGARWPPG